MHGDGPVPIFEPGYTAQDVTKVPGWHGLVAWDLLFNNLTTGLFLFTAVGELAQPALLAPVARAAYPVALVLLLTDLVLLVSDLGDPLRFHHMLRVFKPSSPMSLGTWSLTVYSLPLTLIVAIEAAQALDLLPRGWMAPESIRKAAVVFGLLPAFGSLAYKGVLFSTSSQPGWKDARWLGGFMANSALALGCAQLLAISILTGDERAAAALRTVTAVLLVLQSDPNGPRFPGASPDHLASLPPAADRYCPGADLGRRIPGAARPPARRQRHAERLDRRFPHRVSQPGCSPPVPQDYRTLPMKVGQEAQPDPGC